jgi:CheY-like chemotaxis protein
VRRVDKPSDDSCNVLYLEDNLSSLELLEHILLHRPEIRLMPVVRGQLALSMARTYHPRLILLDLHLPDLPGEEVLRRLREDPETREIPVVVISGDNLPEQIERVLAAGARAYMVKPLDVKKFLAMVDEILGAGSQAAPATSAERGALRRPRSHDFKRGGGAQH